MVIRTALITFVVAGVIGCSFETPIPPDVLAEVYFAADQSLTDESIASTPIILKLSMKTGDVVTVDYSVTGGSAKVGSEPGSDVNNAEGKVTFEPFQDTAMIMLSIVDDGVEEEEEDVRITLSSPENAKLGDQIDHTLRISANKLPRVQFVMATSSAGEETGAQSFAVELDVVSMEDVVARYTWTGTAEPEDHGVTDGLVTIRAGQKSQTIPAPITNDLTDEDDETLDLSLIAQAGAVIAPGLGQHGHMIVDDDPPPAIGFQVTTSAASEDTATATISVSLERASEKLITVDYVAAAGGSAGADDFALAAGTLTFPPGTTTLTVPVTIANDALDEDDETVRVALMNASNATLQAQGNLHTLTITDDDATPTLEFQQAASTASEATATHAVTVQLSAPSGRTVQFALTRAGTASADDLTLPAGPFVIPAGATTLAIDATVIDDAIDDDDETAVLTLTGLVNAGAGPQATHTITIQDDDGPPAVRFDPATPDRSELERDLTTATYAYRVVLSAASSQQVTVNVTVGGTAMNNDFNIVGGDIPVVFQPGQTQRDLRITVSPDGSPEDNETVTLTLGAATNATNAADNQVRTHTIQNDD
jgi:hypothetical protein